MSRWPFQSHRPKREVEHSNLRNCASFPDTRTFPPTEVFIVVQEHHPFDYFVREVANRLLELQALHGDFGYSDPPEIPSMLSSIETALLTVDGAFTVAAEIFHDLLGFLFGVVASARSYQFPSHGDSALRAAAMRLLCIVVAQLIEKVPSPSRDGAQLQSDLRATLLAAASQYITLYADAARLLPDGPGDGRQLLDGRHYDTLRDHTLRFVELASDLLGPPLWAIVDPYIRHLRLSAPGAPARALPGDEGDPPALSLVEALVRREQGAVLLGALLGRPTHGGTALLPALAHLEREWPPPLRVPVVSGSAADLAVRTQLARKAGTGRVTSATPAPPAEVEDDGIVCCSPLPPRRTTSIAVPPSAASTSTPPGSRTPTPEPMASSLTPPVVAAGSASLFPWVGGGGWRGTEGSDSQDVGPVAFSEDDPRYGLFAQLADGLLADAAPAPLATLLATPDAGAAVQVRAAAALRRAAIWVLARYVAFVPASQRRLTRSDGVSAPTSAVQPTQFGRVMGALLSAACSPPSVVDDGIGFDASVLFCHHCFSTLPALARLFLLCPKLPPPPPPTLPLPFAALPPAAARLLVDGVVGHLCAPLLLHLGAAADYAPPPADTLAVDTADADALLPPGTPAAAAADTERHVDVAQAVWSSEPAPLGQRQLPDRLARTEAARWCRAVALSLHFLAAAVHTQPAIFASVPYAFTGKSPAATPGEPEDESAEAIRRRTLAVLDYALACLETAHSAPLAAAAAAAATAKGEGDGVSEDHEAADACSSDDDNDDDNSVPPRAAAVASLHHLGGGGSNNAGRREMDGPRGTPAGELTPESWPFRSSSRLAARRLWASGSGGTSSRMFARAQWAPLAPFLVPVITAALALLRALREPTTGPTCAEQPDVAGAGESTARISSPAGGRSRVAEDLHSMTALVEVALAGQGDGGCSALEALLAAEEWRDVAAAAMQRMADALLWCTWLPYACVLGPALDELSFLVLLARRRAGDSQQPAVARGKWWRAATLNRLALVLTKAAQAWSLLANAPLPRPAPVPATPSPLQRATPTATPPLPPEPPSSSPPASPPARAQPGTPSTTAGRRLYMSPRFAACHAGGGSPSTMARRGASAPASSATLKSSQPSMAAQTTPVTSPPPLRAVPSAATPEPAPPPSPKVVETAATDCCGGRDDSASPLAYTDVKEDGAVPLVDGVTAHLFGDEHVGAAVWRIVAACALLPSAAANPDDATSAGLLLVLERSGALAADPFWARLFAPLVPPERYAMASIKTLDSVSARLCAILALAGAARYTSPASALSSAFAAHVLAQHPQQQAASLRSGGASARPRPQLQLPQLESTLRDAMVAASAVSARSRGGGRASASTPTSAAPSSPSARLLPLPPPSPPPQSQQPQQPRALFIRLAQEVLQELKRWSPTRTMPPMPAAPPLPATQRQAPVRN